MSKKDVNRFIKDLRKLADLHGVRIGFITIDDGEKNVCSCKGIDPDDDFAEYHLQSLCDCLKDYQNQSKD